MHYGKQLNTSRKLNENVTAKYLALIKEHNELALTATGTGTIVSRYLTEEDKFELAAIPEESKYDAQFLTTCIFILHKRDSRVILKLSVSGRTNTHEKLNKIEPARLLLMKNLFCARVNKSSKNEEAKNRIASFKKLASSCIVRAKTSINMKKTKEKKRNVIVINN